MHFPVIFQLVLYLIGCTYDGVRIGGFLCLVFGFLLILDTVTHQAHLIFILNTATAPTNKLNPFLYATVLFPLG